MMAFLESLFIIILFGQSALSSATCVIISCVYVVYILKEKCTEC